MNYAMPRTNNKKVRFTVSKFLVIGNSDWPSPRSERVSEGRAWTILFM